MIDSSWPRVLAMILATVGILVGLGCASPPKVHYYTLGGVSVTLPGEVDSTKPLIRVERLAVAEPYAGRRIVYRPAANEVAFWDFRQWAEPPGRMITARVAAHLAQSGLFRDVDSFPYSWEKADLVLRGAVLAFEEVDRGDEWYGRVKLFLELVEPKAGRAVWSSKIEAEKKARKRNPEALVDVLAEALDEAIVVAEGKMAKALGWR